MRERQSFHTVVSNVAFSELGKLADLLEVVMPRWHTVIQMAKPPIQAAEAGCTLCELKGSFRGRLGLKMTLDVLSPSSQAIYEMSRGEQDLIEDLKLARKVSVFFSAVRNHITYDIILQIIMKFLCTCKDYISALSGPESTV